MKSLNNPLILSFTATLILLLVLVAGYYFIHLKPQIADMRNAREASKILAEYEHILVQNRLALVELTRVDPNLPGASLQAAGLISKIEGTIDSASDILANPYELSFVKNDELSARYPQIIEEVKNNLQGQKTLIEELKGAQSYSEGIEVLTSNTTISLITRLTNLILEIQFWEESLSPT